MISFIIISYKNELLLNSCIKSILGSVANEKFEIIVFNNDTEALSSLRSDETLKIVENRKNIGFGRACNLSARIACGEILFFINPDAEIISGNIPSLLKGLDEEKVGIVAPEILSCDGSAEKWRMGKDITPLRIIANNLFHKKAALYESLSPDWVTGAAFLIKKNLFEKIGGFDERFFMYFEDVDLCKRIRNSGYLIKKSPAVTIAHHGGMSFSDKKNQKNVYYESQDEYIKKHFGLTWLSIIRMLRLFHRK